MKNYRRILITGSFGMLGRQLIETFSGSVEFELMGVDLKHGDLSDETVCRKIMAETAPDIVINAAAFTRVDDCENPDLFPTVHAANTLVPKNLAACCKKSDALLVHISTDYVYDGQKEGMYTESDAPNPLSAYGRTKLAGDQAVMESGCRYLIFRTAWLYGRHGHNFIEAILNQVKTKKRLQVVCDQWGTPTSTLDLALGIRRAVELDIAGLYHLTCLGMTTWYDFAKAILKAASIAVPVERILTRDLNRPAPRPANSRLDCTRFIKLSKYRPRYWEEAMAAYLKNRLI